MLLRNLTLSSLESHFKYWVFSIWNLYPISLLTGHPAASGSDKTEEKEDEATNKSDDNAVKKSDSDEQKKDESSKETENVAEKLKDLSVKETRDTKKDSSTESDAAKVNGEAGDGET